MWNFIKNIFKKKKVEDKPAKVKMDFSNVKFNFNIKSICAFEKLVDKSFFQMTEEDILPLLYSIYLVSNPDKPMRMEIFFSLLEREDIAKWFINKYTSITNVIEQFKIKEEEK